MLDHLPERDRPQIRQRLRRAWDGDDYQRATEERSDWFASVREIGTVEPDFPPTPHPTEPERTTNVAIVAILRVAPPSVAIRRSRRKSRAVRTASGLDADTGLPANSHLLGRVRDAA